MYNPERQSTLQLGALLGLSTFQERNQFSATPKA